MGKRIGELFSMSNVGAGVATVCAGLSGKLLNSSISFAKSLGNSLLKISPEGEEVAGRGEVVSLYSRLAGSQPANLYKVLIFAQESILLLSFSIHYTLHGTVLHKHINVLIN